MLRSESTLDLDQAFASQAGLGGCFCLACGDGGEGRGARPVGVDQLVKLDHERGAILGKQQLTLSRPGDAPVLKCIPHFPQRQRARPGGRTCHCAD